MPKPRLRGVRGGQERGCWPRSLLLGLRKMLSAIPHRENPSCLLPVLFIFYFFNQIWVLNGGSYPANEPCRTSGCGAASPAPRPTAGQDGSACPEGSTGGSTARPEAEVAAEPAPAALLASQSSLCLQGGSCSEAGCGLGRFTASPRRWGCGSAERRAMRGERAVSSGGEVGG